VLVLSGVVQACGQLGRPGGAGQARPGPLLIIALAATAIALAALAIAVFGPPSSGMRL
jgi:hypothetical protein